MDSSTRASVTSASDEHLFIGATYRDLPGADADFEALRQLYTDVGSPAALDAVTIGRKASGEVRFHRESGDARGLERGEPAAPGLAAGLAAALYPSVASDIPARRLAEREILSAVAGVVGIALGRASLQEVGTVLDSSTAILIVAATSDRQGAVRAVLANADSTVARSAIIDADKIERMAGQLDRAALRRGRQTS